jgi:hypothetical protein
VKEGKKDRKKREVVVFLILTLSNFFHPTLAKDG